MEQLLLLIDSCCQGKKGDSSHYIQLDYQIRSTSKYLQMSQNIRHFQKCSSGLYSWSSPGNSFLKLDFIWNSLWHSPAPYFFSALDLSVFGNMKKKSIHDYNYCSKSTNEYMEDWRSLSQWKQSFGFLSFWKGHKLSFGRGKKKPSRLTA